MTGNFLSASSQTDPVWLLQHPYDMYVLLHKHGIISPVVAFKSPLVVLNTTCSASAIFPIGKEDAFKLVVALESTLSVEKSRFILPPMLL